MHVLHPGYPYSIYSIGYVDPQVAAQQSAQQDALMSKIAELEGKLANQRAPSQDTEAQDKLLKALERVNELEKMIQEKKDKAQEPEDDDIDEHESEADNSDDCIVTMDGRKVLGMKLYKRLCCPMLPAFWFHP